MSEEKRRLLDLPDRRQNTYQELEKRLDEHIQYLDDRLRRFIIKVLIALAMVGFASAGAILGLGIVLSNQGAAIKNDCLRTNQRHNAAVAALIVGSNQDQQNAPNEAARIEIRRRRDVTIALLDAVAPVQDCTNLGEKPKAEAADPTPVPTPIENG